MRNMFNDDHGTDPQSDQKRYQTKANISKCPSRYVAVVIIVAVSCLIFGYFLGSEQGGGSANEEVGKKAPIPAFDKNVFLRKSTATVPHFNITLFGQSHTCRGWTEIHKDALNSSFAEFQRIVGEKRMINILSDDGWTVLHAAAASNDSDKVSLALRNGVDITTTDIDNEYTALHIASIKQNIDMMHAILYRDSYLVSMKDKKGCYAINYLPKEGQEKFSQKYDNGNRYKIENLVFQGGGPKGIVYPNAIAATLEYNKITLSEIKKVAGTSVGSIVAGLLAVGYNEIELKFITKEISAFTIFLDHHDHEIVQHLLKIGMSAMDGSIPDYKTS